MSFGASNGYLDLSDKTIVGLVSFGHTPRRPFIAKGVFVCDEDDISHRHNTCRACATSHAVWCDERIPYASVPRIVLPGTGLVASVFLGTNPPCQILQVGEEKLMTSCMVRMWLGVSGSGVDGSWRLNTVSGLELTIAIASYRTVLREEESSILPGQIFAVASRMLLTV